MQITNTTTSVLVLGACQHGSLGIIRSLGELGVPVYGTYSGQPGPAVSSRFCKGAFGWEYVGPDHCEEMCDEVIKLAKAIGRPAVLIPTWDETAVFVAEQYQKLSRWFILPQQSPQLARTLVDKKDMFFLAKEHGISTAAISIPNSVEDVRFAEAAKFPMLLKGIDGNRLQQRTGRKMEIVHTR